MHERTDHALLGLHEKLLILAMKRNTNLNCYVNSTLAKEFRQIAAKYDNRLGFCLSAGILMFLEADPKVQGEFLTRVFKLHLDSQVQDVLNEVKEHQASRVEKRERDEARKRSGKA